MRDKVRVLRVIEYTGERKDIERQVAHSLHGERKGIGSVIIKAATIGIYPEIIETASAPISETIKMLKWGVLSNLSALDIYEHNSPHNYFGGNNEY